MNALPSRGLRRLLSACLISMLLLALVSCIGIAQAATAPEDADIQAIRQAIVDLQIRLDQLEKAKAAEAKQAAKPDKPAYPTPPAFGGSVQLRYRADNSEKGVNQFYVRRARLNARAAVNKSVNVKAELRLESKDSPLGPGSRVSLGETYIEYCKGAQNVRMGQLAIPFDFLIPTGGTKLWDGERPIFDDRYFPDQVDNGLLYTYCPGPNAFALNVAAFNGTGWNQENDNNDVTPFASIVVPIGRLKVMSSYYPGTKGKDPSQTDKTRQANCISYDGDKILFTGEVATGQDLDTDSSGWYAQLGYKLPQSSLLFVKRDVFDEDTSVPNKSFRRTTVGWFRDFEKNTRVTLAYEFRDVGEAYSDKSKFNGNAGWVQWQASF